MCIIGGSAEESILFIRHSGIVAGAYNPPGIADVINHAIIRDRGSQERCQVPCPAGYPACTSSVRVLYL